MSNNNSAQFTLNSVQMTSALTKVLRAGLVPFIYSSPGMGKSSIVRKLAADFKMKLIDHRCSTSEPTDFTGIPFRSANGKKAEFLPLDIFPLEGDPVPEGYEGTLIFLDEFPQAIKQVENAAYRLVLDREVGQYKLHEKVLIVLAGNYGTDNSNARPMGTAMKSRVITLHLNADHETWINEVAIPQEFDSRICAYLSYKPKSFNTFNPSNLVADTFATARTWEFLSKLIKGNEVTGEDIAIYAGTIGVEVAHDFIAFCKVYNEIVTLDEVIANPKGAPLEQTAIRRWACISMLAESVDASNVVPIAAYVERMPSVDLKLIFINILTARKPELRSQVCIRDILVGLAKYIRN